MGKKLGWYPKYPADYLVDTQGLSLAEHGAYNLLMDRYYRDGGLPSDIEHLFNICSTKDEQERTIVQKVARVFFQVDGDRLTHKRIEEELAKMRGISDKRKQAGKNSGAVRRLTHKGKGTSAQQNANKNEPITEHSQSQTQQQVASGGGPAGAGRSDPTPEQVSQNPTPVESINSSLPEKSESSRALKALARDILAYLNRPTGKKFHEVDSNLDPIVARLKEGATPEQIRSVIFDRVHAWGTDEKMAEFLRPDTLFRRSKFWNYIGNITALDTASKSGIESTSHRQEKDIYNREPGDPFDDIPF